MTSSAPLQLPKLDERLMTVASLVPVCGLAADIGADHGRLSCYLLGMGICRAMIVSDISEDSLRKARALLNRHGLSQRARFVVADGLQAVQEPVDAVIITGLGGKTISDMLAQSARPGRASLLLSAHTQTQLLRTALSRMGYTITQELVLRESGRFYTVIQAKPGQADYTVRELFIGPKLRGTQSAKVSDYLLWRSKVMQAASARDARHLEWLREEIEHALCDEQDHL